MWCVVRMSHMPHLSHTDFRIRLGDRGRLVLPAELRRAMGIEPGDEVVARFDGEAVHLISRRQLARNARGTMARLAPGRDLVSELLAERRDGAGAE